MTDKRITQFTYIRVIACFAIVLLHCLNTSRAYYAGELSETGTAAVYGACSVLMWAVPCFLMVTGALLLNPNRDLPLTKVYGKYLMRMIRALLIFTLVFTLIKYLAGEMQGSSSFAGLYMNNLIKDQAYPHLWYLYLMIVLYLLMPVFRIATERLTDRQLGILILVAVAIFSLLPFAGYISGAGLFEFIPTQVIYAVYPFIGYMVFNRRHKLQRLGWMLTVTSVISTLALCLGTYKAYMSGADPLGVFAYSSPLVVLQSVSIFSMMLLIKSDAGRLLSDIDRCTFGIYLIHMVFVRLSMKVLGFNPFDFGPFAFIPMAATFFILSYVTAWVLKKLTGSAIV